MSNKSDLNKLQDLVVKFVDERDWSQFHSSKNIASALSVEAAELLEHYLWKEKEKTNEIEEEIADILYWLLLFAYYEEIDLKKALKKKLKVNEEKYPVEKAKGKNDKYTEL